MPNNAKTRFPTRRRLIGVAIAACFVSAPAWSNPTAPQVVNGAASFDQTGKLLTVTNSSGAIINWNSFSIGAGETTRFNQASAASSVLNRVIANDPSVLLGTLSSNGRVWLVNPAGIMVGQGARVDVAGFIASTLNVRNEDFLAGRLNFGATPNAGSIRNYGQITTPSGGSVFLVAPNVENHGIINAPNGEVLLAAGQTAQLIDTGTPGVKVDITGAEGNVTNLGEIVAEAGRIGMAGVLVKNSGALNASSLVREGGRVFLKAGKDAYVDAAGRIDTTGTRGGSIEVLGHRVAVTDQAQLDASGGTGGGTVLVGGDYQGKNPGVKNSSVAYFGPQASLKADALQLGDGGKVIVWADDSTRAFGTISARGGREGGNGGFVETSGHYLDVAGARVHAGAPNGQAGQWLLDPWDLTISNNSSMSPSAPTAGVFDAAGTGSNVNSADIQGTLNGGTDVVITTGTGGSETGNITVFGTSDSGSAVNIVKSAGGDRSLTLKAAGSIVLNPGAAISSTSGKLNITLNADWDGSGGGAIKMGSGSSLASLGGDLKLGGGTAGDGSGRAIGNATYIDGVYLTGATLDAGGGNIALNGTGFAGTSLDSGVYVTDSSVIQTSGAGTITLSGTGGAGTADNNYGVVVGTSAALSSVDGAISITGVGAGSGGSNYGVYIHNGATVGATGSGTITLHGTGSAAGTTSNYGIRLSASTPGTQLTSASGAISMTGIGGTDGDGLQVTNGAKVQSGTGAITLDGTTGDGGSTNDGVYLTGAGTLVTSGGNIGITGTSISTVGTGNRGVAITSSAQVIATGAATITMTGQGGYDGDGLNIRSGSLVQSDTGLITLNGTSGNGTGPNGDGGVWLGEAGTLVTSGGGMTITGISTSTDSSNNNHGLNVSAGAKATTSAGLMTLNGTQGAGAISKAVGLSGTPSGGVVNAAAGLAINGTGDVVVDAGAVIHVGTGFPSLFEASGSLNINGTVGAQSVVVNADSFTLSGGTWNQVSTTLPAFTVNDFRITGGTFIRALGGDGATSTPYQLTDIYGVQGVGSSGMLGNSYVLANTIEAAGTVNWNSGAGFAPVGTFTGQFDGQSYAINNLTINRPSDDYVGLFGYVGYGGLVKNIGLVGGSVTGNDYVGGLVGENSGSVSDAYNTGAVIGNGDKIGGLVGRNRSDNGDGTISNSHSTGPVNGNDRVGGLVGYNTGEITNSYSTSEVQGSNSIGGLVGRNSDVGSVSNAYSTGAVSGNDSVGGLVGENSGSIGNAYSTGVVTGDVSVGGLVGNNDTGSNSDIGSIVDSHATGLVRSNGNNAGGLVGSNVGSISNAYATGDVDGSYDGGINNVGGLVGYNNQGSIDNAYATGSVSGRDRVGGLVGYNDYGFVRTSYATGNVSGDDRVGGLVGYNENDGGPSIDNTYASGSVTGRNEVGGLVGFNYGADIKDSYSNGLVTGTGYYDVGGLVGDGAYGTVINSYWDTETSGRSFSNGGGIGMTTAQMMQSVNFSSSTAANSFDSPEWGGEWRFIDGIAYPYLQWRFPTGPQIVSGTLNGDSGGAAIQTAQNGNLLRTSTTGANGFYYQALDAGSVGNGSALLAYRANSAGNAAVAVRLADGGHLTGVDLLANNVIASSSGAAAVSNGTLAAAIGSLSSSDIPYGVSANNLTLDPGIGFRTAVGSSYTLDGNVSTSGGASQFWYGPVTLPTTATLSAAGGGITLTNQTSQLSGLNVVADALTIEAANGVGTAATPLTTQVNSLNVLNTTSGGIFVKNIGAQAASVVLADNAATGAVVSFLNTGDITSTSGFTLMTLNGGDLALLSNGNLTWNGGNLATPSGGVLISADGSVSVSGALSSPVDLALSSVIAINVDASGSVSTGGTGTASFIAPSVAINGAVNAADDVGIIANTLNLGAGSSTGAGHDVIFAAANVTATNASVTAGHDISAAVTGDLRLNGSGFTAANDIFIDLMGASSTLYLNDAALLPRSYLWAKAPATIHLDYPARAAGGMVVNGVAEDPLTFEAAAGASGLFYGAGMTPAPFGTGLDVTYGMGSTSAAPTVLDAVQAAIRVSTAPPSDSVDADGRPRKRGGKPGMAKFATCGKPGE